MRTHYTTNQSKNRLSHAALDPQVNPLGHKASLARHSTAYSLTLPISQLIVIALSSFAAGQTKPDPLPNAQEWQRLPSTGLILEPGASDLLDTSGPASPFQPNPTNNFPRRIQQGLPDVTMPSQGDSTLVSADTDADGSSKSKRREAKLQRELQQRISESFPKSFLLDATDPSHFGNPSAPYSDGFQPTPNTSRLRLHTSDSENSLALSPDWEDLHDEMLKRLSACDRYLRSQSTYSAREEAREGLLLLTRRLDQLLKPATTSDTSRKPSIRKSTPHASALQHALRALDEASFESGESMAETLQTFSDLIPQAILQHPWAADLLYALGKSYERETEIDIPKSDTLRLQAIACYQAALRVAPSRPYISNQLGFNHLFNNSLDQAFNALQRSLDAGPSVYAWRNLAELYRRRGDHREALLADEQAQYLLDQSVQAIKP